MIALRDHVAVVTGATSGIGEAIALALASEETKVCLVGRSGDKLSKVAKRAGAMARSVLPCQADLTVDAEIEKLADRIQREFGGVDVLVHCAGAYHMGRLENTPVDVLDMLYRTNVRAPYLLTRALLPMLKPRQGQVVFMNSSQGLEAKGNAGLFACTQHALKAMADSLRQELNSAGVRVLSVYPGRTATPRMAAIYEKEGRSYQPDLLLQPEDVAAVVINSLRLPRTAEVTNIMIRPRIRSY